jgi:hypothetical protein
MCLDFDGVKFMTPGLTPFPGTRPGKERRDYTSIQFSGLSQNTFFMSLQDQRSWLVEAISSYEGIASQRTLAMTYHRE